jgi:hypothetical protein
MHSYLTNHLPRAAEGLIELLQNNLDWQCIALFYTGFVQPVDRKQSLL